MRVLIPLSRGYWARIDVLDADLAQSKWTAVPHRNTCYAIRIKQVNNAQTRFYLHRVILSRMLDRELSSNEYPDHIDGNGLDNRRSNLRLATNQENRWNSRLYSNNTSGAKGVEKRGSKFRASITLNGKKVNLGTFETIQEAHEAYKAAAKSNYGEFARFN
jgi:HNH endonuclease